MMTQWVFIIKESLQFGWNTTKNNLVFFIVIILLSLLIIAITRIIISIFITAIQIILFGSSSIIIKSFEYPQENSVNIIFIIIRTLFDLAIETIIQMGIIKIVLKSVDNQKPNIDDMFSNFHLFFKFFISIIVYSLIVLESYKEAIKT